ncbi:ATP-binding protein [Cytobacillus oceanisediminis]|uniref:ATP-binding protein n=1 Tax=Cytobacillus oceanisediminis TaxID=665099 RepID=UPI0037BFCBF9
MILPHNPKPIPHQHIHNIPKPFFTTNQNPNPLPLIISHKIIQHHNPKINVQSSSQGTTFTITLPIQ